VADITVTFVVFLFCFAFSLCCNSSASNLTICVCIWDAYNWTCNDLFSSCSCQFSSLRV
jgi:hypothetical protein